MRRGAGVVERGGLENRCGCKLTEGSNPSLSAIFLSATVSLRGGCRQNYQLLRPLRNEAVDLPFGENFQILSLTANSLSSC